MKMREIRIDAYIGWRDEESPAKREQFLFNIATDDIDDMSAIIVRDLEDAIAELVNDTELTA